MLLASLSRGILRKYKPKIVMVTGSVGKTSTKDAIAAVLDYRFYMRASEKSYNSEFGVPLTIIGATNPWAHLRGWLWVFGEALALLLLPNHYPKILVLEVGADNPGDLARILKIATPDAVVVTRLPDMPVHVEAYATPGEVRTEEFSPALALRAGAPLIISADDLYVRELAAALPTETITYGFAEGAMVRIAAERPYMEDGAVAGVEGDIAAEGATSLVVVRGALGRPQLLAPAAAIATGLALGMTLKEVLNGLEEYRPPAGRGRLLRGIKGSTILDDSYNASPAAVREALVSLDALAKAQQGSRRIAALGDMLELGRYSQKEHEAIGEEAAACCDMLVAVGERSRAVAEAAKRAGMKEDAVPYFDTSMEAADFLKESVREGDIILIKGSQSIRMERIAEALIASPGDRKHLVRQDREWKRR